MSRDDDALALLQRIHKSFAGLRGRISAASEKDEAWEQADAVLETLDKFLDPFTVTTELVLPSENENGYIQVEISGNRTDKDRERFINSLAWATTVIGHPGEDHERITKVSDSVVRLHLPPGCPPGRAYRLRMSLARDLAQTLSR